MNDKRLRQIMIVLATIGLLVSIYMTVYKYTKIEAMCIGSKDCAVVNASRYSEVNNVPVAVIGMGGYLSLLAILWLEKRSGFFEQNGAMVFFGISLVGFLFTVYLVYVELALIKAYCPFCITSQVSMTLIFILSVIRLIKQT